MKIEKVEIVPFSKAADKGVVARVIFKRGGFYDDNMLTWLPTYEELAAIMININIAEKDNLNRYPNRIKDYQKARIIGINNEITESHI